MLSRELCGRNVTLQLRYDEARVQWQKEFDDLRACLEKEVGVHTCVFICACAHMSCMCADSRARMYWLCIATPLCDRMCGIIMCQMTAIPHHHFSPPRSVAL